MLNIKEAKDLLLADNPNQKIATEAEIRKAYVFSLIPSNASEDSATGGVCYMVNKHDGQIEICSIYDPRLID